MNSEKIMGFDHTLADIDKQIEELYAKRAEIENRMEQARKEAEEKRKAEQAEAYQVIKELIDKYNEKYHGSLVLMERFDAQELLSRFGLI